MFKKTLIMSVATAGLICGTAFAAGHDYTNAETFGVTFASHLNMMGTPDSVDTSTETADLSLINEVNVGLSYFNWERSFALNVGVGIFIPDSSSDDEDSYQVTLDALYLYPINDTNYVTAGLGFGYQSEETVTSDDNNDVMTAALAGGFMHRMDNSVFSVTIPVVQYTSIKPAVGSDTNDLELFAGADVGSTYFVK